MSEPSPIHELGGDRLAAAVARAATPVCVGLDPRPERFPENLVPPDGAGDREVATRVEQWGRDVLDAVAGRVAAVKLQVAFFERRGPAGLEALAALLAHARSLYLFTIADAKRGDIGSTAEAYAGAFLGPDAPFSADALTVSPYLGRDSVAPFLEAARRHGSVLFFLGRTSNPGAADLQDLPLADGAPVHEKVVEAVAEWGRDLVGASGWSSAGLVVGLTRPELGRRLRALAPDTFFLVPGYGAQGGQAEDLAGYFGRDRSGVLVSASRSVTGAWRTPGSPSRWQDAVAEAADRMRAAVYPLHAREVEPGLNQQV